MASGPSRGTAGRIEGCEGVTEDEFTRLLAASHEKRNAWLRAQHRRDLPLGDAMVDRWERARKLGFAEGASIFGSAIVFGEPRVGAQTWIGPNTLLDASSGSIEIGAYCSISAGTQIYTHDTVLWAVSGGTQGKRKGSVSIADNVYIGSQCVIVPNVTIGTRVVVAANSLVNRDVPAGAIVAGTPAKRIGEVVSDEGGQCRLVFSARKVRGPAEP
jgi:acetyltransferase-like isoleucine patch superfamily enzyme